MFIYYILLQTELIGEITFTAIAYLKTHTSINEIYTKNRYQPVLLQHQQAAASADLAYNK